MATRSCIHFNDPKNNRVFDAAYSSRNITLNEGAVVVGSNVGNCIFFPNDRSSNYEPNGIKIYPNGSGDLRMGDRGFFSVEAWVYLVDYPQQDSLEHWGETGSYPIYWAGKHDYHSFCLYIGSSSIKCRINNGDRISAAHGIPLRTWTHVGVARTFVSGVGKMVLFVGGRVVAIANFSETVIPESFHSVGTNGRMGVHVRDFLWNSLQSGTAFTNQHIDGFRGFMRGFRLAVADTVDNNPYPPSLTTGSSYTLPGSTFTVGELTGTVSCSGTPETGKAVSFAAQGNIGRDGLTHTANRRGWLQFPNTSGTLPSMTTPFTIEGWFKIVPGQNWDSGYNSHYTMIQHYGTVTDDSDTPWRIYVRNDGELSVFGAGGWNDKLTTRIPGFNEWFYLSVSVPDVGGSESLCYVHINGKQMTSGYATMGGWTPTDTGSVLRLLGNNSADREYVEMYDYRLSVGSGRYGEGGYTIPSRAEIAALDEYVWFYVTGQTNAAGNYTWTGNYANNPVSGTLSATSITNNRDNNNHGTPPMVVDFKNYAKSTRTGAIESIILNFNSFDANLNPVDIGGVAPHATRYLPYRSALICDTDSKNDTITAFGGGALALLGQGSNLSIPANVPGTDYDLTLGTNFTVEFWFYLTRPGRRNSSNNVYQQTLVNLGGALELRTDRPANTYYTNANSRELSNQIAELDLYVGSAGSYGIAGGLDGQSLGNVTVGALSPNLIYSTTATGVIAADAETRYTLYSIPQPATLGTPSFRKLAASQTGDHVYAVDAQNLSSLWSWQFAGGSSDRISITNSSSFNLSTAGLNFTIEAWIYPNNTDSYRGIIGARQDGVANGWRLYIESGTLRMSSTSFGGWGDRQLTSTTIPTNAWTHVALVKTSAGYTGYVNGVPGTLLATTSGLDYQSTRAVTIGAMASGGEYPFTGRISNVRIVRGQALYTSAFDPYMVAGVPLTTITATDVTTPLLALHSNTLTNGGSGGALTLSGSVSMVNPPTNSTPNLAVVDTAAQQVIRNITITAGSWGVAVRPSSTEVYVSNALTGAVQVISTTTNSVVATITTGLTGAYNLAFNSGGTRCYVSNRGVGTAGRVVVIDTGGRSLVTTLTVAGTPGDMISTGSEIFVAQEEYGSMTRISTSTNTITSTLSYPGQPVFKAIAYDAANAVLYAACDNGIVFRVNSTYVVSKVCDVVGLAGGAMRSLQVSADGTELYFTNSAIYAADGSSYPGVYSVNIATGNLSPRFIPGITNSASALAVSPPGNITTRTNRKSSGWHHFAVTREGTTWRAFVNGVQRHTWTSSINLFPVGDWKIGTNSAGINFNGLVDEFRLTDAVEYTPSSTSLITTITPPAAELTPSLTPFTSGTQEIYANAGESISYTPTLFTESPLEFSYFVVPVKIVVSGAGVSAVNGVYIRDGEFNDKPTYTKQGGVGNIGVYGEGANKVWAISTNNLKNNTDVFYTSSQTSLVSPTLVAWVAVGGVSGPVPAAQAEQTADFSDLIVDRYTGTITGKINTSVPHLRGYNASLGQTWDDVPADPSLGYPTLELYYYWYMSSQDYSANSPAGFAKINVYVRVSYNLTQGPVLPYTHQITSSQDLLHLPTANKVLINAKGYFYLYDIESNGIKRCFYSTFGRRGTVAQDLAIEEELVTPGDFLNNFRKYSWAADSERVYLSVKSSGVSTTEAYTVYSASIASLTSPTAFSEAPSGFSAWNLVTEPSTNMVYFKAALNGGTVKNYKFTSGWSYVEV